MGVKTLLYQGLKCRKGFFADECDKKVSNKWFKILFIFV